MDATGLVLWLALVGWLTLRPSLGAGGISGLCLLCGDRGGADLLRNVLLFMPAGFLLARRGLSLLLAVGVGLVISAGIETIQLFVPGRYSTLRDVLINGVGSGAGAAVYVVLSAIITQRTRTLAFAALAFPLIVIAATAVASVPIGTDGIYYAQWVPRRPYYARWDGAVLSAEIAGLRTSIGRMAHSDSAKALLQSGAPVSLRLRAGSPTPRLAAFYVVMDDSRREVLMIGGDGDDLVVRRRRAGALLRLDTPDQRFPGFLSGLARGDTIPLEMRVDERGRVCVASTEQSACAPHPSLGSAWGFILWKGTLAPATRSILDGITVALALLPFALALGGYGLRHSGTRYGLVVLAMLLIGRLGGLSWPGLAELGGALMAFLVARAVKPASASGTAP